MNEHTESPRAVERLLPGRELPPYSYVTGKFPHPLREPAGHSYGNEHPEVTIPDADAWRDCEAYLWGIDLFNHGYYWEAHESWEAVWNAAGRRGHVAQFCKALIKLAAAGVKAREGRPDGVRRHARRARELFESVLGQLGEAESTFMGLSPPTLIAHAERLIDDPHAIINTADQPVVVVMPLTLSLAMLG